MIQVVTALTELIEDQMILQLVLGDGTTTTLAINDPPELQEVFPHTTFRMKVGPYVGMAVQWVILIHVNKVHKVAGPRPAEIAHPEVPWHVAEADPGDRFAEALFLDGSWSLHVGPDVKHVVPPRRVCGVKPFRGKKFCRVREFTVFKVLKRS